MQTASSTGQIYAIGEPAGANALGRVQFNDCFIEAAPKATATSGPATGVKVIAGEIVLNNCHLDVVEAVAGNVYKSIDASSGGKVFVNSSYYKADLASGVIINVNPVGGGGGRYG